MLEGHKRSKGIGQKLLGNHSSSKVATSAVSREGQKWGKLSSGSARVAWSRHAKDKGCQSCRAGIDIPKAGRVEMLFPHL